MEKTFNISRSKSIESLVVDDKYFKFNPEINWEPVKIHKNSCSTTEIGRKSNQHERLRSAHLEVFNHVRR